MWSVLVEFVQPARRTTDGKKKKKKKRKRKRYRRRIAVKAESADDYFGWPNKTTEMRATEKLKQPHVCIC